MRKFLYAIAVCITILSFSCDTTQTTFDDAVPTRYSLITDVSPEGSGQVDPSEGEFAMGTSVEVRAIPEEGYIFERWEGDVSGSTNPATIVMSGDRVVTAHFIERFYPLTIEIIGRGRVFEELVSEPGEDGENGQEAIAPDSRETSADGADQLDRGASDESYRPDVTRESADPGIVASAIAGASQEDTTVTVRLTAEAEDGWFFDRWEGDLTGSENPAELVVDEEKHVTVVFEPVNPDALVMVITQQPTETVAGIEITPAPAVELSDDQGNPLENVEITASLDENSFTDPSTRTVTTNSNGTATFENLIIETAGTQYILTFDADEPGVANVSSDPFDVVAADPDPANSSADVPDGFAGSETEITVTVRDSFGNRVEGAADDLIVTVSGGPNEGAAFSEIAEQGNGEYLTSYTPESTGEDEITIQLAGADIDGSPFSSTVTTSDAEQMEMVEQPAQTVAGQAIAGPPSVRVLDDLNNPVGDVDVTVAEEGGYDFDGGLTTVSSNEDGIAEFEDLVINITGAYSLIFNAPGVDDAIVSEAFEVIAAEPVPGNTTADVPDVVAAGEQAQLLISVQDAFGNAVGGAAGQLGVTVTGANEATPAVIEAQTAGTYQASYTPTSTGTDEVQIEVDNSPISGSPFSIEIVVSDVNSSNSSVTADPTELQVGNSSELTIIVRDDQNNTISGLADEIQLSGLGSASAGTVTEEGGSGIYKVDITSETPDELTISVSVDGVTLNDQPVITFLPGDADDIQMVSGNDQTGTVTQELDDPFVTRVVDQFGNPVPGHQVEFEIDQTPTGATGQSLSDELVTTDSSGEASTVLTLGPVPGTYTVVASAGVGNTVTFTAEAVVGLAAQATITEQPTNTTAGQQIDPAPAILVLDGIENPVEGIGVTVSLNQHNFVGSTTQVSTNEDGIAEFSNLIIERAETGYTISFDIAASGISILESDAFNITAASGDASNSDATVPNGSAGDPTEIVIFVRDAFGNRAAGEADKISIEVESGPNAGATFESITDEGNGRYETSYTPMSIGDDQISIEVNNQEIPDSPFTSTVSTSDAEAVEMDTQPGETVAGETIAGPPSVLVTDELGNPVANVDVTVSEAGGQSFASGTLTRSSNSSGIATFDDLIINSADTYRLDFNAVGASEDARSEEFDVIPAAAGAITKVSGDGQSGDVNETLPEPLVVEVTDEFGNTISGQAVSYSITGTPDGASGESLSATSPTTGGNGRASSELTLGDTPGTYTVQASINGVDSVSFTAEAEVGDPSAMNITQQPTTTTAGDEIEPAPAVRIADDNDNPVEGIGVSVTLNGGDFASSSTTSATTNSSGIASFDNLIINDAGTGYSLTFDTDASGVSNETSDDFNVEAASPDPNSSTATVPDGTAGQVTEITIFVEDGFGNPINGEADNLEVEVSGANTVSPSVSETSTDGEYTTSYTPQNTGSDFIAITLNNSQISGSPYTSDVSSGGPSGMNIVTEPSDIIAGASIEPPPAVEVVDDADNPIQGIDEM